MTLSYHSSIFLSFFLLATQHCAARNSNNKVNDRYHRQLIWLGERLLCVDHHRSAVPYSRIPNFFLVSDAIFGTTLSNQRRDRPLSKKIHDLNRQFQIFSMIDLFSVVDGCMASKWWLQVFATLRQLTTRLGATAR